MTPMRKSTLFTPGTDLHPNEKKRRAQPKPAPDDSWRQSWQPLPPTQPRNVRAGSMDFLALPSVIGERKD